MKSVHLIYHLWEEWGIQFLVTVSLACQITLAILASHRRHTTSIMVRGVIFAAYFLSSSNATLALNKLIVLQINNPERTGYITELKGLLAPLILMHLGYLDSITAYSFEDSRLGSREILNLLVAVGFVVWILIRCSDSLSPVAFLYCLLLTTGIIRSAGMVWALKSVYWARLSMSTKDIFNEQTVGKFFDRPDRPKWSREQTIILKAYHRFDCLKPHIVNWLYHPESLKESRLTVNHDLAFITTEVELGFMYDVLYTKQPILYKPLGLIGCFTSFFCLVSALCGFAIIFKNAFFIDMYITYTYALLMGVTALEGYQIVQQPFTPWAIVVMSHHRSRSLLLSTRLLNFLAERYMKQKRWSNSVGQLNLLDQRLYDKWTWSIGRILKHLGIKEVTWRSYWIHSCPKIPSSLKELLVANIEKFDAIRDKKPFTERGNWTLKAPELSGNVEWTQEALEVLKRNISRTFDKSIIIWHMATNICLLLEPDDSPNCKGSELLSNYMIYLLALHPRVLSLPNTIQLDYACAILKLFLRYRDRNEALGILSSQETVLESIVDQKGTIITREWHVLLDVRELAVTLKGKNNKWQIISSFWVEMLCYAAYNCQVHYHTKLLREGGGLITHVWLLLMHHTDKYTTLP